MREKDNRRKYHREIQQRECKPFRTFPPLSGQERQGGPFRLTNLLSGIERALLRALLALPPEEQREDLSFVRTFEGRQRSVISLWYTEMKGRERYAMRLLRACGIRFN